MMDSSQVFLTKCVAQAPIHDIDLENPFHEEKVFIRFVWERLSAGLDYYVVRLLADQQLL